VTSSQGRLGTAVTETCVLRRYFRNGQYDESLHIYLDLGRGDPFSLITEHGLYKQALKDLVLLFDFDSHKAVELLLNHMDDIPV
jgi:hypothetical protein